MQPHVIDIAKIDDIDKLKSLAFDLEQQKKQLDGQYDLLINRINQVSQAKQAEAMKQMQEAQEKESKAAAKTPAKKSTAKVSPKK